MSPRPTPKLGKPSKGGARWEARGICCKVAGQWCGGHGSRLQQVGLFWRIVTVGFTQVTHVTPPSDGSAQELSNKPLITQIGHHSVTFPDVARHPTLGWVRGVLLPNTSNPLTLSTELGLRWLKWLHPRLLTCHVRFRGQTGQTLTVWSTFRGCGQPKGLVGHKAN
jgi:hypothetical protein